MQKKRERERETTAPWSAVPLTVIEGQYALSKCLLTDCRRACESQGTAELEAEKVYMSSPHSHRHHCLHSFNNLKPLFQFILRILMIKINNNKPRSCLVAQGQ